MRRLLVAFVTVVGLFVSACSSATGTDPAVAAKDGEIADLKLQIKQRDEEISSLKKSLAMTPPPQNQNSVAVGQGDGRFVVIPSKVRVGFPIGIFTDEGDGQIRITRAGDGKEVARMDGPKASQILLYTIPQNLEPGSYRIIFSGHGGTTGEAVIQVDAN